MKRGNILAKIIVSLLLLIAIVHFTFQITVFGTGISGVYEKGISGLSIGRFSIDEKFRNTFQPISPISKILLITEWSMLIIWFIILLTKKKMEDKSEIVTLSKKYKTTPTSTDLDILYNILKEKKHLKLSTISRLFDINKEIALNWCKMLESGNLATLNYPKIGVPEITLNE